MVPRVVDEVRGGGITRVLRGTAFGVDAVAPGAAPAIERLPRGKRFRGCGHRVLEFCCFRIAALRGGSYGGCRAGERSAEHNREKTCVHYRSPITSRVDPGA